MTNNEKILFDALKELRNYLDDEIASLPCESRIRTMDEDIWSTGMFLRDKADTVISLISQQKVTFNYIPHHDPQLDRLNMDNKNFPVQGKLE